MRVAVGRFERALFGRQLRPLVHVVVSVAGAFREERTEEVDVGRDALLYARQPRGETLRQIAGRRVVRAVKTAGVSIQDGPVDRRGPVPDVRDVETSTRDD